MKLKEKIRRNKSKLHFKYTVQHILFGEFFKEKQKDFFNTFNLIVQCDRYLVINALLFDPESLD